MEIKVNYVIVGVFVLGFGVVLIVGIFWLVSGGGFEKKYDFYLVLVGELVVGFNLNVFVKYCGVDVGKVWEIKLDFNNF